MAEYLAVRVHRGRGGSFIGDIKKTAIRSHSKNIALMLAQMELEADFNAGDILAVAKYKRGAWRGVYSIDGSRIHKFKVMVNEEETTTGKGGE